MPEVSTNEWSIYWGSLRTHLMGLNGAQDGDSRPGHVIQLPASVDIPGSGRIVHLHPEDHSESCDNHRQRRFVAKTA